MVMASFNRVILVGNITRDIELKYTASQLAVVKLGLAVNDRVKKQDSWVDEATYVDVTLFGRTAEIAKEYLSKGSSVLIEGRLKLDTWEQDGQKRSKLYVIGDRMQMLGARPGGGSRSHHNDSEAKADSVKEMAGGNGAAVDEYSPPGDDLPF
jgi:single-strand DNA-binding protein